MIGLVYDKVKYELLESETQDYVFLVARVPEITYYTTDSASPMFPSSTNIYETNFEEKVISPFAHQFAFTHKEFANWNFVYSVYRAKMQEVFSNQCSDKQTVDQAVAWACGDLYNVYKNLNHSIPYTAKDLYKWATFQEKWGDLQEEVHDFYTDQNLFSKKSKNLPGVESMVEYPCKHGLGNKARITLWGMVQHLNDVDRWGREQIADWLDILHDEGKINIEFEVESISDDEIECFVEGGES